MPLYSAPLYGFPWTVSQGFDLFLSNTIFFVHSDQLFQITGFFGGLPVGVLEFSSPCNECRSLGSRNPPVLQVHMVVLDRLVLPSRARSASLSFFSRRPDRSVRCRTFQIAQMRQLLGPRALFESLRNIGLSHLFSPPLRSFAGHSYSFETWALFLLLTLKLPLFLCIPSYTHHHD